jgi:hypothetical protein
VCCDITPAKLIFENGGLLLNYPVSKLLILDFDARQIPTRRAGACNTFKKPAGGMVGYSKPGKFCRKHVEIAKKLLKIAKNC